MSNITQNRPEINRFQGGFQRLLHFWLKLFVHFDQTLKMLKTSLRIGLICLEQSLGALRELACQPAVTSLIEQKFTISVGRDFTVQSEFFGIFSGIVSEQIPVATFDSLIHFFLAIGHAALNRMHLAGGVSDDDRRTGISFGLDDRGEGLHLVCPH